MLPVKGLGQLLIGDGFNGLGRIRQGGRGHKQQHAGEHQGNKALHHHNTAPLHRRISGGNLIAFNV